MPVYSFSTKTKKPQDTEVVEELKKHCDKHGKNFSAVIISKVKEYMDEQRTEV